METLPNLKAYQKKVASGGTAVQLLPEGAGELDTSHIKRVTITPLPSNAGVVVIGDSGVVATSGSETGIAIPKPLTPGYCVPIVLHQSDLASIYINAVNTGDGVSYLIEW